MLNQGLDARAAVFEWLSDLGRGGSFTFARHTSITSTSGSAKKLIDKMARKHAVPFLSGRLEIWAAAVVYTIGSINFLFDTTFQPYASTDSLCDYFKVSKSTVGQKAKLIREMFKMGYYDPEFSTEHTRENNLFACLALVDGFLVIRDP